MEILLQVLNFLYQFAYGTATDRFDYALTTLVLALLIVGSTVLVANKVFELFDTQKGR